MTETEAIEAVDRHLRQGEPLLAYNAVQEGLARWPENLRLRQLKGLATARSGDTERANRLLRELADAGHADGGMDLGAHDAAGALDLGRDRPRADESRGRDRARDLEEPATGDG